MLRTAVPVLSAATLLLTGATSARADGQARLQCPEVSNEPAYTVTGTPYFLQDNSRTVSTYLYPNQSISWRGVRPLTFIWEIGDVPVEEAAAVLAAARLKLDPTISDSYTWIGDSTVTENNTSSTAYVARLGQMGWKITAVKSWVAAPCTPRTTTFVVKAPHRAGLAVGREPVCPEPIGTAPCGAACTIRPC
ncbi:hypothetical protein [Actinoplanes sp. HUAS TT8]|uniref:hypothetical protein n=1 Tax=Actinoplanes sp. HUAS TT8 TaxID=3447453 RepID=UPI003F51C1F7